MTIQHLEADRLTPLQFLQQRNTVEHLTVQIPRYIQRGVTAVSYTHLHNKQRLHQYEPLEVLLHYILTKPYHQ